MSPRRRLVDPPAGRWWLLAAVIAVMLMLPAATWIAASRVNRNCDGIHKIVTVGSEIIAGGRTDLEAYYREGTITRAQRDRALAQVEGRLRRWRSADCR